MLNIGDWAYYSLSSAYVRLLQVLVAAAEVACKEMASLVDLTGLLHAELIVKFAVCGPNLLRGGTMRKGGRLPIDMSKG